MVHSDVRVITTSCVRLCVFVEGGWASYRAEKGGVDSTGRADQHNIVACWGKLLPSGASCRKGIILLSIFSPFTSRALLRMRRNNPNILVYLLLWRGVSMEERLRGGGA